MRHMSMQWEFEVIYTYTYLDTRNNLTISRTNSGDSIIQLLDVN